MNLIQACQLRCVLGNEPLFEGLDFAVQPGEVVRLRGRNGSGKSTFLRALVGKQPVDGGDILFSGRSMHRLSPAQREELAPLVDQSPLLNWDVSAVDNLVDTVSVGTSLCRWLLTPRRTIRKRILEENRELVQRLGLIDAMHRPARELSIGQRRLLTLLRALRRRSNDEPRVLLLDEPLAGLRGDRIGTVLAELQTRLSEGWAIVVAEHIDQIEELAPRYVDFPYRNQRTTKACCAASDEFRPDARSPAAKLDFIVSRHPEHVDLDAVNNNGGGRPPLLQLCDVSAGYFDWEVVANVNLQVRRHEITAIVGPNAAGKSTLFRALFADEETNAWLRGKVLWGERKVQRIRGHRHIPCDAVAWIPQERFDFPGMTVQETLCGALVTREFRGIRAAVKDLVGGLHRAERRELGSILKLVKRLGETRPDGRTTLKSRWETLSGGERAMATLAMGLINSPQVVFLDEPAANLDAEALTSLQQILRSYVKGRGAGCLLIEHRASFLADFADSVVPLDPNHQSHVSNQEPRGSASGQGVSA